MIDAFDIIAFAVFGILLVAGVALVVFLGSLPGRIARQRGHPQAAAINVAAWLGLVTGILWLLALIWAFLKPSAAAASRAVVNVEATPAPAADAEAQLLRMQARVDTLEAALRELRRGKEVRS
jgi:hypothetical protein